MGWRAVLRDLTRPAGLLTIVRIPLGFVFLAVAHARWAALAVLCAAALSDALDGTVARARHETSLTGEVADPIADKVFAACVLVGLLRGGTLDALSALALVTRELGLLSLALYILSRGRPRGPMRALPLGKLTTVAQFCAAGALIARWSVAALLVQVTALLGILAAASYWDRELATQRLQLPRTPRAGTG